jgi:hypothetical protein
MKASITVCGDQSNNSRVLQIAAATDSIRRIGYQVAAVHTASWVNGRFTLRKERCSACQS